MVMTVAYSWMMALRNYGAVFGKDAFTLDGALIAEVSVGTVLNAWRKSFFWAVTSLNVAWPRPYVYFVYSYDSNVYTSRKEDYPSLFFRVIFNRLPRMLGKSGLHLEWKIVVKSECFGRDWYDGFNHVRRAVNSGWPRRALLIQTPSFTEQRF